MKRTWDSSDRGARFASQCSRAPGASATLLLFLGLADVAVAEGGGVVVGWVWWAGVGGGGVDFSSM